MKFNFTGNDLTSLGAGLLSETSLAKGFGAGLNQVTQNRKERKKHDFEVEKFDALKEHRARQFGLSVRQLDALENYRGAQLKLRSEAAADARGQRKVANNLARERLKLSREELNNPAAIREYKALKEMGELQGKTYTDYLAIKKAGGETFGKNPFYGTDKDGNPVLIQAGSKGTANVMQIPGDVTVSTGVDKIDLGDRFLIIDKRSGQQLGYQKKNLAEAESQKVQGKVHGEKVATAGEAIAGADDLLTNIDEMITHPGRKAATGRSGLIPETAQAIFNQDAKNFIVRAKQLSGSVFLQGFEKLKGGGPITEVEGQQAKDATARMDRAQSEEAYLEALNDFKKVVKGIRDRRSRLIKTKPGADGWTDVGGAVRIREKKP